MIHYLLCNEDNQLLELNDVNNVRLYRSFKLATKASKKYSECVVVAFSSKMKALSFTQPLYITDKEPKLITKKDLIQFAEMHSEAKKVHPARYGRMNERTKVEEYYTAQLFGFDTQGRSITARQYMSLSRKWCRYSAPIFINGKKATIKTLIKELT